MKSIVLSDDKTEHCLIASIAMLAHKELDEVEATLLKFFTNFGYQVESWKDVVCNSAFDEEIYTSIVREVCRMYFNTPLYFITPDTWKFKCRRFWPLWLPKGEGIIQTVRAIDTDEMYTDGHVAAFKNQVVYDPYIGAIPYWRFKLHMQYERNPHYCFVNAATI